MGKAIQVNDGDLAMFCVTGGVAKWVKSTAHLTWLRANGLMDSNAPTQIYRADLSNLSLVGAAPVYPAGYTGPRTYSYSFG